jgi:hypothetical protein
MKIDSNRVEWLAQRKDFHEYWFHGKVLNGRYLFSKKLIASLGEDRPEPEWFFTKPFDQTPFLLSAKGREWISPLGFSALPGLLRKKIPEKYKYWKAKNKEEALAMRNEFLESAKFKQEQFCH